MPLPLNLRPFSLASSMYRPGTTKLCDFQHFLPRTRIIFNYLGFFSPASIIHFIMIGDSTRNIYCRRAGVKARYDSKIRSRNVALVTLPSKIRRYFSFLSFAVLGRSLSCRIPIVPGGRVRRMVGKKSITRGVARNPVDHPHGGRTKSIATPLSP